ncbi:hypothetical protein QWA68_015694 [Fusarium oxysporum]|nr:hypothetical protein QWA68_015694 [Fusarium oxysporum]
MSTSSSRQLRRLTSNTSKAPAMASTQVSGIACFTCRERKVKCSRELPECSQCLACERPCKYPNSVRKPGPKLGSKHPRTRSKLSQNRRKRKQLGVLPEVGTLSEIIEWQNQSPSPTPEPSAPNTRESHASEDILSISHIIHPSHDTCSVDSFRLRSSRPDSGVEDETLLASTSHSLGVTQKAMREMLQIFFATFSAFRLFREPHVHEKLVSISNELHLKALLTAIFAFATKSREMDSYNDGTGQSPSMMESSSYFGDMAIAYTEEAVLQCADDTPPLCVLQACILVTHWLLIRGVRGRAWRSLGLCVRIAYEMGLHVTDAKTCHEDNQRDPDQWCQDEEYRRAWWAVWEMDVFASVLYRIPCTINWAYTRVWLPAEDGKWFQGQPQASCCLDLKLVTRSKTLQKTGNESPKAWVIVMQSFIAEAHVFACQGDTTTNHGSVVTLGGENYPGEHNMFLDTVFNSIQLCSIIMPSKWKYRRQLLHFDTLPGKPGTGSLIHTHSSVYELALMQEVAKLITLKTHLFQNKARRLEQMIRSATSATDEEEEAAPRQTTDQKLAKYFQASDTILNVISTSNEAHIRYVNPYLAHASWMAASVQLLRQELTIKQPERDLIRSGFEILKAVHMQFVDHWSMSTVPLQKLDALEGQLSRWIRSARQMPAQHRRTSHSNRAGDVQAHHHSNTRSVHEFESSQSTRTAHREHLSDKDPDDGTVVHDHVPSSDFDTGDRNTTRVWTAGENAPNWGTIGPLAVADVSMQLDSVPTQTQNLATSQAAQAASILSLLTPSLNSSMDPATGSWEDDYTQGLPDGDASFQTEYEAIGNVSTFLDEIFSAQALGSAARMSKFSQETAGCSAIDIFTDAFDKRTNPLLENVKIGLANESRVPDVDYAVARLVDVVDVVDYEGNKKRNSVRATISRSRSFIVTSTDWL